MLLRFRAVNIYSFRDEFELNLLTHKRGESGPRFEPTRVAALYGANASGKSNVLLAMRWMAAAVTDSGSRWVTMKGIPRPVFKLDPSAVDEASLLEIEFILDGTRFVYGFEVSDDRVETEWLYEYATGRRRTLFVRDADRADEYDFKGRWLKGDVEQIAKATRPNALYLSTAAVLNHPRLSEIYNWFLANMDLRYPEVGNDLDYEVNKALRGSDLEELGPYLRLADLGVSGARVTESKPWVAAGKVISAELTQENLELIHRGESGPVAFDLGEESIGTLVWLLTLTAVLRALRSGSVLLVDELDGSLHPHLVAEILRLFRDVNANPNGAQLICTLHDVSLFGSAHAEVPLGRREIWITEKSDTGKSEIYPLTDARPATQENLERGYLRGRYGGVPRIGAGWLAADVARLLGGEGSEPGAAG